MKRLGWRVYLAVVLSCCCLVPNSWGRSREWLEGHPEGDRIALLAGIRARVLEFFVMPIWAKSNGRPSAGALNRFSRPRATSETSRTIGGREARP